MRTVIFTTLFVRSTASMWPIRFGPTPIGFAPISSGASWPRQEPTHEVPEVQLSGIRNRRSLQELWVRLLADGRSQRPGRDRNRFDGRAGLDRGRPRDLSRSAGANRVDQ